MDMRRRDLPQQPELRQGQTIKVNTPPRSVPLRAPVSPVLAAQMAPRPTPMPTSPAGQPIRPASGQSPAPSTGQRPTVAPRPTQPAPGLTQPVSRPAQPVSRPAQTTARPSTARPVVAAPSGNPAAAAAKASGRIEELFQVIRQLCELLTKENAALKRHRTEEVKAFAERKEYLARLYQGHMTAIQRDHGPITALDPARRALLSQQAMRLGELMQENAALLKGSIQAINMFFKAVTDAVREKQEKMAAAYSRRGAMSGYIAKRSLAVSFNQTM